MRMRKRERAGRHETALRGREERLAKDQCRHMNRKGATPPVPCIIYINISRLIKNMAQAESSAVPRHIAFIPDGMRRWARKNGKEYREAYDTGIRKFGDIIKWLSNTKGVEVVSFWAFSTENFKRSDDEKALLFALFEDFVTKGLEEYTKSKDERKSNVKINFLGSISRFPEKVQEQMKKVMETTKGNGPYTANILMGYGGRQEILDAVNGLIKEGAKEVDEAAFSGHMYTAGMPDPDLIIRTSGEKRLSGLMPWQSVYSEFIFMDKFWPDLQESDVRAALDEYAGRKRRFGKG
jgi:undecaprenyl diphosphate synthase